MEKSLKEPESYYGKNGPKFGLSLVLAASCVFLWGITFVNTKYLSRDFSSLEILALRFLLAYVALWIFCPRLYKINSIKDELAFAAAGFSGITFYQFLENVSISYTYASNVSIIVSTCPMFTAIVSQIFLKEKFVTKKFIFGFLLSIAGVALVTFSSPAALHLSPKGDLLALTAAVSWAFYSLVLSKISSLGYPSVFITRRTFFWALVMMVPLVAAGKIFGFKSCAFSLDIGSYLFRFSNPLNVLNIAFLGFGASAFCFFAWSRACSVLGTVRTTAGLYFVSVVTIIFGAAFLGERLGARGILGAAMVILGLILSTRK